MRENEYLLVYGEEDGERKLLGQYCFEDGKLRKFGRGSIVAAKNKFKDVTIYPRNDEQVCAFDLMKDDSKTVKLLTGTWGSGKTLILVEAALEALRKKKFERII